MSSDHEDSLEEYKDLLEEQSNADLANMIESANLSSKILDPTSPIHDQAYLKKVTRIVDEDINSVISNLNEFNETTMARKLVKFIDIEMRRPGDIFAIRWSSDNQYIAAGASDGIIKIYNLKGQQAYEFNTSPRLNLPCTCIRFRPSNINAKTKNVVLTSSADGSVDHWHMTSGKLLYKIQEENNQVYALDYSPDGMNFATAGRDCKVRIYEEATKACIQVLGNSDFTTSPGHSNRIFSVKYKVDDPNILISAGWDNTVQFWDLRADVSVRSIFGPHVCGDSLDINNNSILTGSWRPEKALQIWDFGTGKLIKDVHWATGMGGVAISENAMLYTAQFSPDGSLIAAGGTGTRDVRVFDVHSDYQLMGRIRVGQQGVFTLDFTSDSRRVAIAGNSDVIAVRDIINARDAQTE